MIINLIFFLRLEMMKRRQKKYNVLTITFDCLPFCVHTVELSLFKSELVDPICEWRRSRQKVHIRGWNLKKIKRKQSKMQ